LITKLRWQLGNVKFIVYLDSEVENVPSDLSVHDVLCLRTDLARYEDLEATLEQLVHGLFDEHATLTSAARRHLESVS
jgi:hypothetical protein